MDIKEASRFQELFSENERDSKDLVKKVKIETIASSSDIKPEQDSISCSQNERHHLMRLNETIKEDKIETKVDIKEEHLWLEQEYSCINNNIKAETREDFYSTKPPRSDLFSGEDSGNYTSFSMNKNATECESDRTYHSQESVVTDVSSVETCLCSEASNDGKMVSMASSSKQSNLLQQSSRNKQDINKKGLKSILSHKHRNSYVCDVSEKCLKYPFHLGKHKLVLDSIKAKKYDFQDNGLNQLSSLGTHKLLNDAKRTHMCSICSKAFIQLSHLKRHKLIHEGIKPHKCNMCNKAFTRLSDLKKHKLYHEGIKPHKCNICSKAFTELSDLKRHKLIHEGIKPHKCNICKKAFTQSSSLKSHKLIHEGIKSHKCDICKKAFTQLSHLKSHKLIHEGIKPHGCNICGKAFTHLSSLKKHKLIHKDTPV